MRLWRGLAGVAALVLAAANAHADTKAVYFLTWGGTVQQSLENEGWGKKFTEATGYTVTLVPKATGPEIIAAAIAQKDKPQVDVVMTDLMPYLAGDDQGIFAPLKDAEVPTLSKLAPGARVRETGVMPYGDVFAFLYNTEVFKKKGWAPPNTSWDQLERPELKGALVLPPVGTVYGLYTLVALARLHGGSETDIEPGMAALKKIAPGVVEWPTTFARMGQFLQDESAAMGLYTSSTAKEFKRRGIPVDYVIPKPLLFTGTAAGIMKDAPNPAGARAFLAWYLDTPFEAMRAERYGNITTNTDVPPQLVTKDELAAGVQAVNMDVVNKNRTAWTERFEREILTAK